MKNHIHLLVTVLQMSLIQLLRLKKGNEAFQNTSFGNASVGNGNEDYSCLWAKTVHPKKLLILIFNLPTLNYHIPQNRLVTAFSDVICLFPFPPYFRVFHFLFKEHSGKTVKSCVKSTLH